MFTSKDYIATNKHKENDNFHNLKLNKTMATNDFFQIKLPYALDKHHAYILEVESSALKNNPLGDPSWRHNYILVPVGTHQVLPVIFHLSGYFSTGFQNFDSKILQDNYVQKIDQGVKNKKYPPAIHVFVEATTYWGGSQFINSHGSGQYAQYILKDLVRALYEFLPISHRSQDWCVMGGSSGGYGALALISEKSSPFGLACAVAPDSYFTASLLPEIFHAAPELAKYKNFSQIKKCIKSNELQNKKSFFGLANTIAMAHCYSPASAFKKDFLDFPIDLYTGEVKQKIWKQWLKHDPIHFLKNRKGNLKNKRIYLDVGKYDNFSLQFGTRQIADVLKQQNVKHRYTEFAGDHFDLSERRLLFLETLKKHWQ